MCTPEIYIILYANFTTIKTLKIGQVKKNEKASFLVLILIIFAMEPKGKSWSATQCAVILSYYVISPHDATFLISSFHYQKITKPNRYFSLQTFTLWPHWCL